MLRIENLSKTYKSFQLSKVSLSMDAGDYFVILGKSGAGKSLILEMVAGILQPQEGSIYLGEEEITHKKIQDRKVGLVFQDFALFPHLKVWENLAYPIRYKYKDKKERMEIVRANARDVGVEHLLHRYPNKLSGGEKQRVALARTLANKPELLLLDEPLASLDVQLKGGLRELLRNINNRGITIVHVTHDYEEAIALANKVAVMHDGKIVQQGKIHEVFNNPVNEFVARFTGVKNFFKAEITEPGKALINNSIPVVINPEEPKGPCQLIIESKHIIVSNQPIDSSAVNNFEGEILKVIPNTNGYELAIDLGIVVYVQVTVQSKNKYGFIQGQSVCLSFKAAEVKIIY